VKKLSLFLAAAAFAVASLSQAQAPQQQVNIGVPDLIVKVSTEKGTYAQLFNQIASVCPQPSMQMSTSAGTVAALNDILNNKANVAFMTAPVLYGKKLIENDNSVDKLRVIMPMYTSELHIIARRSDGTINQFTDVGNKKVATFGGAFITARIILAQSNLRPIAFQDYQSEKAALAALQSNQADVVFIEVGQPATWATELDGQQFKFVEFNKPELLGRNGFTAATLHYQNISQTGVRTLGSQVYLITQDYKSAKKVADISALKSCIARNYETLKETTGNHPKWEEVRPNGKTEWPMFQTVPTSTQPATRSKK
jgi:TRAP-type uncharacterized transport system substrate-binding protein